MTEDITCPYCNAQFPRTEAEKSARGFTCPRCGEPLPAEHQQETGITATAPNPLPTPLALARPSNRTIGFMVLAVMVAVALIGLAFALQTTAFRRGNDRKVVHVDPVPIEPPSEWAGLGYLPGNCNLLAGLQLADAFTNPLGKKLLAEPRPQLLELGLGQFEKWTGFKAEDLNQVVLGVKIPDALHVVAITRELYKIDDRFKLLKLEKIGEHRGQPLFSFRPPLIGDGRLWCPDRNTIVLAIRLGGFKKGDLDELPLPARSGSKGFSKEIQETLANRVDKQSVAWVCGHGDWQPLLALARLQAGAGLAKDVDILAKVKTFGLSLSLDNEIVLNGQLFTGDAAVSQSLQKFLLSQAGKGSSLRVEVPPADVGNDAQWVTLQRKMTLEEGRLAATR